MFEIEITRDAADDLKTLRRFDQNRILDEVDAQLAYQADVETRNRKRLRPNLLAEWELRIAEFRVFYDIIEANSVRIVAVGQKIRNRIVLLGRGGSHEDD